MYSLPTFSVLPVTFSSPSTTTVTFLPLMSDTMPRGVGNTSPTWMLAWGWSYASSPTRTLTGPPWVVTDSMTKKRSGEQGARLVQ